MTTKLIIFRVEGDIGPPLEFSHSGIDLTGYTITARFIKEDGEEFTRTATVSEVGDPAADTPAVYSIAFQSGDLTRGDHEFDIHYSASGIDDYSIPADHKITLRVRE